MSTRIVNKTLCAAIAAVLYSSAASAQQAPAAPSTSTELDTVVVTGSLIKGTPVDTALPVSVFSSVELEQKGSPSALEFVKSLAASGPTTGEAYYFGGSNLSNNVGFNLRGLGADKTLTIFNGKRAFENSSVYPNIAIDRVEVLKDGAAVTYGADATGGVVNMITKDNFRGFDVSGKYKWYKGTDEGEWKLAAMAGFGGDSADVLFAVEWDHRSELPSTERDFTSKSYFENPAPWSTLTTLAGWLPRGALPANPQVLPPVAPATQNGAGEWGNPTGGVISDFTQSSCEGVGGVYVNTFTCAYNYIPYYHLVEDSDIYRVFGQVKADITDTSEFYFRGLFARSHLPHQYGSPSQPVVRGPARLQGATYQLYVPAYNPYVQEFAQRTGFVNAAGYGVTQGYTPITYRPFSHGGNSTFAVGGNHSTPNENLTDYWHMDTGFTGEWAETVNYDIGISYNQFRSKNTAPDILGYRLQLALSGYGGPNCNVTPADPVRYAVANPGTAGANGCEFFNPFASAFQNQPVLGLPNTSYGGPGFENHKDRLVRWLFDEREVETTNYNTVFDATFSGETPLALPGGNVAWGAGVQWAYERERETVESDFYNGRTPCDYPNQDPDPNTTSPSFNGCTPDEPGPFLFFATNVPDALQQRRYSYFAQLDLPILESLNFTAAGRREHFSGDLEATVYKVSGKWQIIDQLALRGSYGTNYQAPGLNVIPGEIFNQVNSYTIAGGNWRGATQVTRSDIEPETAKVWSAGLIGQFGFGDQDLVVTLDYWNIETQDELGLLASANDIANAIFTGAIPAGRTYRSANCSHPLVGRVTFNGGACVQFDGTNPLAASTADDFADIRTDFGNGPGQTTAGFDFTANYTLPLAGSKLRFGIEVTKVEEFEFTPTILDGVVLKNTEDRLGYLNFATVAFASPEWRGNLNINYEIGEHNIRAVANYTSGVDDERFLNADGSINPSATGLVPAGRRPGEATNNTTPSYFGIYGDDWISLDLIYLWSASWGTLGFTVLNVADRDPPEAREEFGYDPRIGSPLGRQFELSYRKKF